MTASLSLADGLQLDGLSINAGLLAGLVVQIRSASISRKQDLLEQKQRATLLAWEQAAASVRSLESALVAFFGPHRFTVEQMVDLRERARAVSDALGGDSENEREHHSALGVLEDLRALMNTVEHFCIAIELGALDRAIAQRIAGWRLARILRRYAVYVASVREGIGSDEWVFSAIEAFVTTFLTEREATSDDDWVEMLQLLAMSLADRRTLFATARAQRNAAPGLT